MKRIALLLVCCVFFGASFAQKTAADEKIEALLKQMTLEEKLGQLNQYSGDSRQTGPNRVSQKS